MTNEEIYEKVMGDKPNKEFGLKFLFSWNDIDELMSAVKKCSLPDVSDKKYNQKQVHIDDVMRCFFMKEDEIKDSIKYDLKYFEGNNVTKITERLNTIEDLRDLIKRVVLNNA